MEKVTGWERHQRSEQGEGYTNLQSVIGAEMLAQDLFQLPCVDSASPDDLTRAITVEALFAFFRVGLVVRVCLPPVKFPGVLLFWSSIRIPSFQGMRIQRSDDVAYGLHGYQGPRDVCSCCVVS